MTERDSDLKLKVGQPYSLEGAIYRLEGLKVQNTGDAGFAATVDRMVERLQKTPAGVSVTFVYDETTGSVIPEFSLEVSKSVI